MSLTYGYDLKKGDKMLEAPEKTSELLTLVTQPGALLANHFPFCAVSGLSLLCQVSSDLMVLFSTPYSLMDTIHQLRTTGANS
jgi:hypothetical protein